VPSTVTVAAKPRDQPVFLITKRTGNSKTSPRKIPTKTIRNVLPIATKAPRIPIAAETIRIVRIGMISSRFAGLLGHERTYSSVAARRPASVVTSSSCCTAPGARDAALPALVRAGRILVYLMLVHRRVRRRLRDSDPDRRPARLPTIGLALWWAVMTVTTVGYGDIVPTTTAGRLVPPA
jgi:hypothetical protein